MPNEQKLLPTVWLSSGMARLLRAVLARRAYRSIVAVDERLHDIASITKGVVALLIGIAFDRGWLSDLDAPIVSFFPNTLISAIPKNLITLRHLLAMTSGPDWPERAISLNNWGKHCAAGMERFRSVSFRASASGRYDAGSCMELQQRRHLVARPDTEEAGQPIEEFAKEALFEPLGIKDEIWDRFRNGDTGTSGGLRLRPRDLAKLGQLVLNGGVWHGRQIVSADWIKQMTAPAKPPRHMV